MSYDNHPMTLMDVKADIFRKAVEGNWIFFFAHDPGMAAARIKPKGKGVDVDQAMTL
jgi:hypothetical protein